MNGLGTVGFFFLKKIKKGIDNRNDMCYTVFIAIYTVIYSINREALHEDHNQKQL